MHKIFTILSVLALGFLVSCNTPTAPHVVVTPTGPATQAQLAAQQATIDELKAKSASQQELAQRASGGVYGGVEANQHNPDGLPKEAVSAQLAEAASALPEPTPEQKLEKANQNARILSGELAAVKTEMGQAITENQALKAKLAESDKRVAAAELAQSKAEAAALKERSDAQAKLQKQFDEMSAKIQAAQDEANNKVMQQQVKDLNRAAMACAALLALVVGAGSIFGGIAGLRLVAPFAGLLLLGSLICFGLAQIIAMWWFKWAVFGAVGLVLAICAWYAVKHYQMGTLQADAAEKVGKLTGVLHQTIPVLDKAYNEAEGDVKKFMDDHIFTPLNDRMDARDKATVHELRAVAAVPETPKI